MYAEPPPSCPDPYARAPRAPGGAQAARLHLPPPALQGALIAVVSRDTRGLGLDGAQRLTHLSASPLLTLSWFDSDTLGIVERGEDGPCWRPLRAQVALGGSQSRPLASWGPREGRGGFLCMTADVARHLFGIDPAALQDQVVDAAAVLDAGWQPLFRALVAAPDDAALLAALEQHLAPRWQALRGRASAAPTLEQVGRHWVQRLARQAHEWRRTHSARQVERRVRAYSGRSLREWQALVRSEGVFFAARARFEAGLPFDWAGIAHDEGFADQAHLSRVSKAITGFSPSEFARRFGEDESFWLYRLWI
jgi:AraC-like DNA-binding protein